MLRKNKINYIRCIKEPLNINFRNQRNKILKIDNNNILKEKLIIRRLCNNNDKDKKEKIKYSGITEFFAKKLYYEIKDHDALFLITEKKYDNYYHIMNEEKYQIMARKIYDVDNLETPKLFYAAANKLLAMILKYPLLIIAIVLQTWMMAAILIITVILLIGPIIWVMNGGKLH